jgi:uncharacterized membrane protein
MIRILTPFTRLLASRSASINLIAAISAPVVLLMAAVGLDHGNMILSKRTLQQHADLAAIVGSYDIANAEAKVLGHFQRNGADFAVRNGAKMLTRDGVVNFDEAKAFAQYGGYAELVRGQYLADVTIAPDKRFIANASPSDALKVTIRQSPKLFFPSILHTDARLGAVGVAAIGKVASAGISSRLASVDGGIVNAMLSALTGTTVSLQLMDSQALVAADINVLSFVDQLALDLNLKAATYEQVLATEVTFPQMLASLSKSANVGNAATTALSRLVQQTNKSKSKLKLEKLINLGSYGRRLVGSVSGLELKAGLMEVISAAANIANAGKQIAVDLDAAVPGLLSTKLTLWVGEPAVEASYYGVRRPGSAVRTAQTRLKLVTEVKGLAALLGIRIKLPIYVDIAKAEGLISGVTCSGGLNGATAGVDVAVKPAVFDIMLGSVNENDFFGTKPVALGKAEIIDVVLVAVDAKSRVTAGNQQATTLKFSDADIKAARIKSISTSDLTSSLTASLFSNLSLDIRLPLITLVTPTIILNAIGESLQLVTKPIDDVLFNVLELVGVRIGEADVRVSSAMCQRPVVVN